MTLRAFIIGLAAVAFICGVTYFNDAVLGQNFLIGNFLPVVVFGPALLYLIFINPALGRWRANLALAGSEMAVVITMAMCACAIPGTNLMRKFTTLLMLPHHLNRTEAGWKEGAVLERVPDFMLADPSRSPGRELDGFIQGLSSGQEHLSLFDIPWAAWSDTLYFWVPLILILWIGLIGLGLVLHRQWSDHEKLPYPVIRFLDHFMSGDSAGQSLMRNRGFLCAAGMVLLIHLSNYLFAWNPGWIEVPLSFDFSALLDKYPVLSEASGQASHLANPHLYFSVIAIAFFLSREVSLSMGLGPFLFATVMTILLLSGIPLQSSGIKSNMFAPGAGFGLITVVLFTGWFHYLSVFKSALHLPVQASVHPHERWGMRIFFVSQIIFVVILTRLQVDWRIALMFSIALVATFVILSRALAETGLFYMQTQWAPTILILALLGNKTVGPDQVAVLLLLGMVLQASPRSSLLPFFINSLKLLELRRVSLGRGAGAGVSAVLLGLLVAIPVTLYFQYDRGVNARDLWAVEGVPRAPFQLSLQVETQLESTGELLAAQELEGWDRWRHWEPNRTSVITFLIGFVVFLTVAGLRLRFAGWPLHPILFLFWNSPHLTMFAASFLIGWGIKFAVTRYGGETTYNRLKPVMLGIFTGEMLGALIPVLIGWVYTLFAGGVPPSFTVLPYF